MSLKKTIIEIILCQVKIIIYNYKNKEINISVIVK